MPIDADSLAAARPAEPAPITTYSYLKLASKKEGREEETAGEGECWEGWSKGREGERKGGGSKEVGKH